MYFDYTIVLAFSLAGALFVLVGRSVRARRQAGESGTEAVDAAGFQVDARHLAVAMTVSVLAAATTMLFAWALVLRDCLRNTDAAQSRGIGARSLLVGGVFLALLSLGMAYVRKQGDRESIRGSRTDDPATNPRP